MNEIHHLNYLTFIFTCTTILEQKTLENFGCCDFRKGGNGFSEEDFKPFPTCNNSAADDFENIPEENPLKLLLTLSIIQTLPDASAADGFLKTNKRRNYSKRAISPFARMFSTFSHKYPFNYRDFLVFDKICAKASAAELSYEGKG